MVTGLSLLDLLLLLYAAGLGVLVVATVRLFQGFPRLPEADDLEEMSFVSVILPVRNQAETVAATLDSLLAQTHPGLEVIVVEGRSEDGTPQVLEAYGDRIRLLEEPPLPEGWVGKNWACWRGVQVARGELLLFTDGDTLYRPDLVVRAVAYLEREDLDLLTLYPRLRMESFWERAFLPLLAFLVGLTHRGARMNRPDTPWAMGNGMFLLFRRAAYDALGGHAAVRARVDEDYRLALRTKAHGLRIRMVDAQDLLEVRMYRNLREVWMGFAKNLFPGLDFRRARVVRSTALLVATLVVPFLLLGLGVFQWAASGILVPLLAGGVSASAVWARLAAAYRRLGSPWTYALLAPFTGLLMVALLLDSARRYLRGEGVAWKGRVYGIPEG